MSDSGMPAPSIPNLLTLRGARGGASGARGRMRGRGGSTTTTAGASVAPGHDTTIQGTDTDAAVSRLSAVDVGYLEDPYASYFVQTPARRLPIINRGTYTRTTALDRLIAAFLYTTEGQERQIVSLGAGTDTRPYRLFKDKAPSKLIYHEIDFPIVTERKYHLTRAVPDLRAAMPNADLVDQTHTWRDEKLPNASQYWCHGLDLRHLTTPGEAPLQLLGLRTTVATLLISECCLCYLQVTEASGVVQYFKDQIPRLALVLYEPIHPNDPFGRQMVSNLAARRIRMPTLDKYTTIHEQVARLRDAGFSSAHSLTIETIWEDWPPPAEKERVDGLEGLDEVEEWNLLAKHYSVSWGSTGIRLDSWRMNPM